MVVSIGCSGWSYDDWIGRFYPSSLANRRFEWLHYYGKFFPTVEINSTFYRVPTEDIVKSWVEKSSQIPDFDFSVKMPQIITHQTIVNDAADKAAAQASSFEDICIRPLADGGVLGTVLIQLSPYFKLLDEASMQKLRKLFEVVSADRFKYAVEFRHRSWLNDRGTELKSDVLDLLVEFGITNTIVDGPAFPITRSLTARHAYVRFHGRNYDIWFKDDEREDDHRINRYDYLYSEEQLGRWKPRLEEIIQNADEVRIYFNNHGMAKAAKNALYMMDLLGIPHEEKEIVIQDQKKLGEFA
ncbi:MAG TPA: DUF72 domain-containing protein [Euryarchaeota archaeon]|nr:DUF72 domain-containing protein [Euryarchaeota archaeon]